MTVLDSDSVIDWLRVEGLCSGNPSASSVNDSIVNCSEASFPSSAEIVISRSIDVPRGPLRYILLGWMTRLIALALVAARTQRRAAVPALERPNLIRHLRLIGFPSSRGPANRSGNVIFDGAPTPVLGLERDGPLMIEAESNGNKRRANS